MMDAFEASMDQITLSVSRAMADEILQWAKDEQTNWPDNTAYQAHLSIMVRDLAALIAAADAADREAGE